MQKHSVRKKSVGKNDKTNRNTSQLNLSQNQSNNAIKVFECELWNVWEKKSEAHVSFSPKFPWFLSEKCSLAQRSLDFSEAKNVFPFVHQFLEMNIATTPEDYVKFEKIVYKSGSDAVLPFTVLAWLKIDHRKLCLRSKKRRAFDIPVFHGIECDKFPIRVQPMRRR